MREPSALVELIIYATVAWLVIRDARVRELLRWSPALASWLFVGFLGLCVLGQMLDTPRRTYPFVSWTMYSGQTQRTAAYHEITLTLKDGAVVPLSLNDYPTQPRPLLGRLLALAYAARRDPTALSQLTRTIRAMAARRHAPGTVEHATIWRCDVDLSSARGGARVTRAVTLIVPLT